MDAILPAYLGQLFQDPQAALAALLPEDRALAAAVLAREEEIGGPRDQWGNWEFSFSRWHREGLTYTPWVDERVLARVRLPRRSLWPGDKPFALCLTHDVDFLTGSPSISEKRRRLLALARSPRSGASPTHFLRTAAGILKPVIQNLFGTSDRFDFHDLVQFEDSLGFRSTFFFVAEHKGMAHAYDCFYGFGDRAYWDGRKLPAREVMVELHRAGWEVGVHGSYHSAVEAGLLLDEKRQIEAVIGAPVVSCRQHYLHFESRVTPDLQAEAGFKADSTHGFNRDVGFRAGTAFPYPLFSNREQRPLDILEVPQQVMDAALFSDNALGYPAEQAIAHVLILMDKVQRVGGVLTLSWHPFLWNTQPEWRRVYEAVLLEAHRRNAYGCSLSQILECVQVP